ncbi:hypothetical protein I7I48_02445 [Histoplasma ohiense]|nr:hypothetical protein I7I48_02445 [Histoplasma ohiense (nom. inval.)]
MTDVSVLSSAAVFSALIHVSAFSAPSDSISLTSINPLFSFYTDFSLSSTLQEVLHIFHSLLLYSPHLPSAPTASTKMQFHTQALYNTIHFTSYSSVAPLA